MRVVMFYDAYRENSCCCQCGYALTQLFPVLTSRCLQEFLCAINGHVMKEPVKARTTGLVFECATIELWLSTRGAVCPITNTQLLRTDLTPDDDLRNR
jgi:hypothetical protein